MTSTERDGYFAGLAAFTSCALLLCGALGPATSAEAHHTKPHQEAVKAARRALFDRHDPRLALRHLEGLWSTPPTDGETAYLLGLAHFLLYDPDRALSMFDACLSLVGRDQSAPQQRLDCLYWSARAYTLKGALAWYDRTSILDGLFKSRRAIMVALDLYEQVLAQAPEHVGTLLGQAEYYMAAPYLPPLAYGDVDKARALVARALALERDNLRANYLQARLDLYHNGRRDLARSRFAMVRKLLDRGAGGPEALLLRRWVDFAQAEVAFLDQNFPAAIAYADAYLSQVPDGAEGYALKGACLKFLGQQKAGEMLIDKATELNPFVRRYREP
jgi:tetratricopeptide (TPR) repeat protein